MNILVVDPGLATGVTWAEITDGQLALVRPYEMDIRSFWTFVNSRMSTVDVIVCESFIISVKTGKLKQAPWSLELIGLLRERAWTRDIPFVIQKPGEALEFEGTPSKAREYNLWVRGGEG